MPCFSGEDVAKEFKNEEYKPLIIFTTSHSEFAKKDIDITLMIF